MRFEKIKLKDITTKIGSGSTPRGGQSSYLDRGEICLIRSQNVYNHFFAEDGLAYINDVQADKLRNVEIQSDDLLINITGDSVARTLIIDDYYLPARINQHVSIIRCDKEKVYPQYLSALLTSRNHQRYLLSLSQVGGTRAALTKKMLEELEVELPSLAKQRKIGDVFSNINEKIKINNEIIQRLEELAQTLFKHWFVEFEFPNEEEKPYKSSGGKMVENELGLIPEGWEVKQLNEIVTHSKKSFNPKKEERVQVAHFSLPAYDSQQYPIFEDSKTIKSNKYYIDENSVMFSRMNPKTPRTWLPNIQSEYINVCSSEYVVLDTLLYENKGYVFSLITSNDFDNYLINNATGSTNSRQRVRPEASLKYIFAHNEQIAKEFEGKIGSFYKEVINLREEIFALANLRDTLLPKLLSGEIELPDDWEVTDDVSIS